MKHGSFKAFCVILLACVTVLSGFADDLMISWETKILESFNGDSNYVWKTDASRFITRTDTVTYPQTAYVNSWPIAAFGSNIGGDPIRSFGIHGRFDRRGYNWIDIYPVLADGDGETPFEIPIPGRVNSLDMWVWGSNLNFYIEIYVRDHQGVVHILRLGDISYAGWRDLRVNIPSNIQQSKRILPRYAGLTFVKFRIWSQPVENVGDFYIYFKQFKALTDMFETYFDGEELADPDRIQELWTNANN
jgi:hypothetical protein